MAIHKYFDIGDIQVPYQPFHNEIQIVNGEAKPLPPTHVLAFQYWLKNPNYYTTVHLLRSIAHEVLRSTVNQGAPRFPAIRRVRILGSGTIPYGEYWLSKEGLIINHEWAKQFDKDSDGDSCSLLLPETYLEYVKKGKLDAEEFMSRKQDILWRINPLTVEPMVLHPAKAEPVDTFEDFTAEKAQRVLRDTATNLGLNPKRGHSNVVEALDNRAKSVNWDKVKALWEPNETGLITTKFNVYELWQQIGQTLKYALTTMYRDPARRLHIEGGLKKSRIKSDSNTAMVEATKGHPFESLKQTFNKTASMLPEGSHSIPVSWVFVPNRITSLGYNACKWVFELKTPMAEYLSSILNGRVNKKWFREVKEPQEIQVTDEPDIEIEEEGDYTIPPGTGDPTLIPRMSEIGALQLQPIPHALGVLGINAVQLVMTAPDKDNNWHIVAGINRFRENEFCQTAVLYPVWDSETDRFIDPIEHMTRWFAQIPDFLVHRPSLGDSRVWRTSEFFSEKFQTKRSMFHQELLKYISRFGDTIRGTHQDSIEISHHLDDVIASTVVLAFRRPELEEQIQLAQRSIWHLNWEGAKSSNWFARKCLLTDTSNVPLCGTPGADKAREGKILSQILHSAMKAELTVAIVSGSAHNQCWITSAGLRKLKADVFNRQVCPAEHPDAMEHSFYDIHGNKLSVHLTNPRHTMYVPKVIDKLGNKFIPRKIEARIIKRVAKVFSGGTIGAQLVSKGTTEVGEQKLTKPLHVIIPFQELLAKGCLHTLLKDATEQEIEINGQIVKAFVLRHTMYRSGIPSENVTMGKGLDTLRGVDGLKYESAYETFGFGQAIHDPDWSYVEALQEFAKREVLPKCEHLLEEGG